MSCLRQQRERRCGLRLRRDGCGSSLRSRRGDAVLYFDDATEDEVRIQDPPAHMRIFANGLSAVKEINLVLYPRRLRETTKTRIQIVGRKQFVKDGPRPAENDIGQSCAMRTKHGACFAKKVNLLGNGETSRHNHPDTLRLQKPYQRLFIFRRSVGTVGACDIQN